MSLSHLDDQGRARMIDVGAKAVTRREDRNRRAPERDAGVRALARGMP